MFINRDKELATIRQHLDRRQASLLVLYGRRRVGKTALLRQACRGRRHIFFTADLGSSRQQLDSFSATALDALADNAWLEPFSRAGSRLCSTAGARPQQSH